MTVIHHARVTGTAGGVWIGETGELVLMGQVYLTPVGKGLKLYSFNGVGLRR